MEEPVNKKPKIDDADDVVASLLGLISSPGPVAQTLLQYLSINELTHIGMTCRNMRRWVALVRSLSPSIVWEKRIETKIGFGSINTMDGLEGDYVGVLQVQRFCFGIRGNESDAEKSVHVKFSLENEVWHEHNNMRDGRFCPDLLNFPKPTRMRLAVIAPKKSYQPRSRVFIAHPDHFEQFGDSGWDVFFVGEDQSYVTGDRNWSLQDKEILRRAMKYIYLCAQRVSNFQDGTAYPSAKYLMRLLPEWLHPYFPPGDFNWNAPPRIENQDRTTNVEFSYRPARSIAEWSGIVPPVNDGVYEYFPDEIPWYSPGYAWFSDSDDDETSVAPSDDEEE